MDSNEENRLRDLRGRLKNTNNTPAVVVVSEEAGGNPAESKGEWFPRVSWYTTIQGHCWCFLHGISEVQLGTLFSSARKEDKVKLQCCKIYQ